MASVPPLCGQHVAVSFFLSPRGTMRTPRRTGAESAACMHMHPTHAPRRMLAPLRSHGNARLPAAECSAAPPCLQMQPPPLRPEWRRGHKGHLGWSEAAHRDENHVWPACAGEAAHAKGRAAQEQLRTLRTSCQLEGGLGGRGVAQPVRCQNVGGSCAQMLHQRLRLMS